MRHLYSLLWYLATPLLAVWLLRLAFRDKGWADGWRERFGFIRPLSQGGIWIHAASVGEVQASLTLIRTFRERWPDLAVTVTTFTPSGREHARRNLPDDIRCILQPLDLPGATTRFVERLDPGIAIIIETELWPNLYAACANNGVPVLLVSARVTERGARRYARWRSLFAETLSVPEVIGVQTDADADRFERLGAPPMRVTVTGNIKFDLHLPDGLKERATALRAELICGDRPTWIAASTHAGEEQAALEAHAIIRASQPDALLILAPRHPARGDEVAALIDHAGFSQTRRSGQGSCETAGVFLLDSLGELALFYGLAQVAFVGGSLVPSGGHNLLEPAALELPLVCGPYVDSVAAMHALMKDAGAVTEVRDARELGTIILNLLIDPALRARQGRAAADVLARNRGTVDRVMQLAEGLIKD